MSGGFANWQVCKLLAPTLVGVLLGCSTEGKLGMITASSVNVSNLLQVGQEYEEHGSVKGRACHYHVLLVPFGNSDISVALGDALADTGSDAVIHATTSKWYAGFPVPMLGSLFDMSCTTVAGTAIKFQNLPSRSTP